MQLHGHDVLPHTGGTRHDRLTRRRSCSETVRPGGHVGAGHGYDKPDLAFVVLSAGSPVAYYQQVGRAGRQLDESVGVLLRGVETPTFRTGYRHRVPGRSRCRRGVVRVYLRRKPVTIGQVLEEVT